MLIWLKYIKVIKGSKNMHCDFEEEKNMAKEKLSSEKHMKECHSEKIKTEIMYDSNIENQRQSIWKKLMIYIKKSEHKWEIFMLMVGGIQIFISSCIAQSYGRFYCIPPRYFINTNWIYILLYSEVLVVLILFLESTVQTLYETAESKFDKNLLAFTQMLVRGIIVIICICMYLKYYTVPVKELCIWLTICLGIIVILPIIKRVNKKNEGKSYVALFLIMLIGIALPVINLGLPEKKLQYEIIVDQNTQVAKYIVLVEYEEEYVVAECTELDDKKKATVNLVNGYKRYLPKEDEMIRFKKYHQIKFEGIDGVKVVSNGEK